MTDTDLKTELWPWETPPVTTSTAGDPHEGCGGTWLVADDCDLIDRCDKCGEERA